MRDVVEDCTGEEFRADRLGPANVSSSSVPVQEEPPGAPSVTEDNADASS